MTNNNLGLMTSLIGLFYCFASVISARASLAAAVIDGMLLMLESLGSAKSDQGPPSIRWNVIWWLLGALIIGIAGVVALLQADAALPSFALGALWQAVFLFWLGPRYWDQLDEPSPEGRQQSKNAFWVYLIATALIGLAWVEKALIDLRQVSESGRLVGLVLALTGSAWFAWRVWQVRADLIPALSAAQRARTRQDADPFISNKILVKLSQSRGFFFNANSGEAIPEAFDRLDLPLSVEDMFDDWMVLWVNLQDPADAERRRIIDPSRLPDLQRAAETAFKALLNYLGNEGQLAADGRTRLLIEHFELAPVAFLGPPELPRVFPKALALRLEYQSWPLWPDPTSQNDREPRSGFESVEAFSPDELGLSWGLARHIEQWGLEYDDFWHHTDPGAGPRCSPEELQNHLQQGEFLVTRIRNELTQTGREAVPVRFVL